MRTRVGMEASCRWEARHNFAAFDVPVPGSCALDVHYTVRSTDSLNPYPEQCRISLKVMLVTTSITSMMMMMMMGGGAERERARGGWCCYTAVL